MGRSLSGEGFRWVWPGRGALAVPVDIAAAIVGWLVQVSADAGVHLVRGSADDRALKKALRAAIREVVAEVSPQSRKALENELRQCFSSSLRLRLDASTSLDHNLRAAITTQLSGLGQLENRETRRRFYEDVGITPDWLAGRITDAIIAALRQVGSLPELVERMDIAEILAALRAGAAPPPAMVSRTLPREPTNFMGRQTELEGLMHALTESARPGGVVAIHAIDGMAGVGKTAFAVHAARKLMTDFPDGQLFVRLHAHTPGQQPTDPADALSMLLLSAGVTAEAIPVGLDARIALWRDRMADRKVLLLLDDATGPEQVYPLLPESDRSLVLITSRLRLVALDDAVFISVNILSRQDAAGLFVRLASRPDLQPTDPAVAEIVHLCGYLPLAIRVIAGRAATHPAWSLDDLVIDLAAAKSRLALLRAGNISVAAAFDLSYTGLTIRQRRLFRRLALHPGSDIDLYAAAALDGSNLATTRRHLDDLYDQHLIEEPAPGRFRFHDLIREHARALAASDQAPRNETAIRRLLDYYLRTAITADRVFREISTGTRRETLAQRSAAIPDLPTYESALTWLETERLNLAVAVTYAASHGQSGLAAEMSRAISPFAQRRGYWDQTLPLHQTALTAARAQADTSAQASILNDLAILHWMKGEYQVATAQLNEAQLLYADLGNQAGLARTLINLGVVQYLNGDLPAATTTLTKALDLCRNLGDQAQEADALLSLAEVQSDSEDPAAVAAWERSLELYSNLGSRRGQAYALVGISIMQHERAADEAAAAGLSGPCRSSETLTTHAVKRQLLSTSESSRGLGRNTRLLSPTGKRC